MGFGTEVVGTVVLIFAATSSAGFPQNPDLVCFHKFICEPCQEQISDEEFLSTFLRILCSILKSWGQGVVESDCISPRRRRGRKWGRNWDQPQKQFTIHDVQVPPEFLRIEYMISYVFLGTMYGLGFLVFYQSLLVPVTKALVTIIYSWLLWLRLIKPVTLQEALQQLPPT